MNTVSQFPKVSVIIPTYNRAPLLQRAMKSVLAQTYENIELIIVDNASSDNTSEIIKDFKDERIKYLRHSTNKGGSAARNTGIRSAEGEFISLLDDDDELFPEKIERQIRKFNVSSPEVGVIYCGYSFVHGDQIVRTVLPRWRGDVHELCLKRTIMASNTALVKRKFYFTAELWDETFPSCQDWDMWIRLSKYCEFDFIPDALTLVYIHGNQISTNLKNRIFAIQKIIEKYKSEFLTRKKVLSFHFRRLGYFCCLDGKFKKGFNYCLLSLIHNPIEWKFYVHFFFFLLPPKLHQKLIRKFLIRNYQGIELYN